MRLSMGLNIRLNQMRLNRRASMTFDPLPDGRRSHGSGALEPRFSSSIRRPAGPQERPESRREELERELAEARYRLGPVRIAPWATLHDVAYVRSLVVTGEPAAERRHRHRRRSASAPTSATAPRPPGPPRCCPSTSGGSRQTERAAAQRPLLAGLLRLLQPPHRGGAGGPRPAAADRHPRGAGAGELPARRRRAPDRAASSPAPSRCSPPSPPTAQNNLVEDVCRSRASRNLRLLDRDERVERAGVRWRPEPAVVGRRWAASTRRSTSTHRGSLDRSNSGTAPVAEVRFDGATASPCRPTPRPLAGGAPGRRLRALPRGDGRRRGHPRRPEAQPA